MSSLSDTLRRWNMRRILRHHPIPHHVWRGVARRIAILRGLDAVQMGHLRELATWFLHNKAINGAQGLEMTPAMRVAVPGERGALQVASAYAVTLRTAGDVDPVPFSRARQLNLMVSGELNHRAAAGWRAGKIRDARSCSHPIKENSDATRHDRIRTYGRQSGAAPGQGRAHLCRL